MLTKECLCIGLSNAAAVRYEVPFLKKYRAVTICPGPNIENFTKIVSLQEMTDHIYGRTDLLSNPDRPHMFIRELELYVDYFREQVQENPQPERKALKDLSRVKSNLLSGVAYYRGLCSENFFPNAFEASLEKAEEEITSIFAMLN